MTGRQLFAGGRALFEIERTEGDKGLAQAGIERDDTFVTNIVKHFKWEPRGKRRLHKKPNAR